MCQPVNNNRVTMIFGAGASIPFFTIREKSFLDTWSITDLLRNSIHTNINWTEFWLEIPDNNDDIKFSLSALKKIMDYYFGKHPAHNFEDVIHFIDTISIASAGANSTNEIFNYIMDAVAPNAKQSDYHHYGTLLRLFICYYEACLEQEIFFNKGNANNSIELINRQLDFFQACQKNSFISLMSLNYDSTIYRSIRNGNGALNINPHGFDSSKLKSEADKNVDGDDKFSFPAIPYGSNFSSDNDYMFPHGHMRLQVSSGQTNEPNKYYFYTDNDVVSMVKNKIARSIGNNGQESIRIENNKIFYNTSIVTGREKKDSLANSIFEAHLDQFDKRMKDSNRCIVIGYSFSDEHINEKIKTFLEKPDNRIMIIGFFFGESLLSYKDYKKFNELLPANEQNLGFLPDENSILQKEPTSITQEDLITFQRLKVGQESPSNRKNGWLVNNRIYLYLDGYKAFLEDTSRDTILSDFLGDS